MISLYFFILEVMTSLLLSALILSMFLKPLRKAMPELCGSSNLVEFWLAYARIMLFFYPLLLVLLTGIFSHPQDLVEVVKTSLVAALVGVLLGLALVGKHASKALKNQKPVKKDGPMFDY